MEDCSNRVDPIPSICDVTVIGAGIAGLTAAALLSKAGLHVVVLEANSRPGGFLSGFERRGFTFDTAIQWLNQCKPGGIVYNVFSHLGDDFPKCKPLARIRRFKGNSFDYLLTTNPHKLRDRFIEDFPGESRGIHRFFADSKVLGERLRILQYRMRAMETMSIWEKALYGFKMLHWVLPIWKHLNASAERGLDRYFEGEDFKRIFCIEKTLMSLLVPISLAFMEDFQAPPVGGSQAFIKWLQNRVESSGSQVLLNRRVEKVLLDGNRAVGVSLADGQTIRSRYVLAACDVESLYERMLPIDHVPANLCRRLREADIYYSNFTLFIGLDCDVTSLGLNEECVNLSRDGISRLEQSGGDQHKTALTIMAPSFRDPTLAPEGKGTLTIHCPAFFDYSDHWKTEAGLKRGQAYRDFKQEYGTVLVERVEKTMVPGLRDHIEVMEMATPVTYWRYSGNRAGSIMGATPTYRNIKNKLAHYRTPVQNLLLGGQWAEYSGGVPIAIKAGTNTSLIILKELKKTAYRELRDLIDGKEKSPDDRV